MDRYTLQINPTGFNLFTGKMLTQETGLDDPEVGRFISPDPAGDGENLYQYCGGNPVNCVDPDGQRIWFIHGTNSTYRTWITNFSAVRQRIATYFGDSSDFSFNWGPNNNDDDTREAAANVLAERIRTYHRYHPNEKIRLVGHSHGGNVAILVANILGNPLKGTPIQIDNIITVATPVREYQIEFNNVSIHNQVYNTKDGVQVNGGKGGKTPYSKNCFGNWGEIGSADRTFGGNTNNILVNLNRNLKGLDVLEAHGIMLQDLNLWIKQIEPKLRR